KGATPRLGGLGLAFGVALSIVLFVEGGYLEGWPGLAEWWPRQGSVLLAASIVLAIGVVDDTRNVGPRAKLLGQAIAVIVLYAGGIRIRSLDLLGLTIDLGSPSVAVSLFGQSVEVALPCVAVTMLWFLGCMNVWNLIDGMDGLASGVGLLVSGTLTLVAFHNQNVGVAILAAALAGSLAGFLLYNWHPACIFLGDSGSLMIGFLIGVIGVEGSLKGPSAISILFPLLAMGLPIADTAMAIFRRWVRNLPFSSADRRHIHHLLIGLGLDPRQAALLLYCFSGFLCGVVLLGVALRSELLALILGLSGSLAFLLILTSRRDELASLRSTSARRRAAPGTVRREGHLGGHPEDRALHRPAPDLGGLLETSRTLDCEACRCPAGSEASRSSSSRADSPTTPNRRPTCRVRATFHCPVDVTCDWRFPEPGVGDGRRGRHRLPVLRAGDGDGRAVGTPAGRGVTGRTVPADPTTSVPEPRPNPRRGLRPSPPGLLAGTRNGTEGRSAGCVEPWGGNRIGRPRHRLRRTIRGFDS
ncbi:MAG: MraY family glycosyltransferase, partial [Singulisphaera sp.]